MAPLTVPPLDELLRLACAVAEEGAALVGSAVVRDVETKTSPTDMVSAVDRAAEQLIAGRLRAARPHDALLGEEGAAATGTTGVRWVVDPLDGTTNYLYGFPAYAVSLAAEVDGVPAVGVVVDVARGETFAAVHGRGATLDGRPLRCSAENELSRALVGTGFNYDAGVRAEQAAALVHVLPRVRDIRRVGSAALDLCAVAAGRLDAYFERGLAPWDWAAGGLVAAEAGAVLAGHRGEPPSARLVSAAAPGVAAAFAALLDQAGA